MQLAVFVLSLLLPMQSAHSDYWGDLDGSGVMVLHADDDGIDSDSDGLKDGFEIYVSGTDPLNWDSNNNGYSDGDEYHQFYGVNYWYSTAMNVQGTVTFSDFDGDGIPNWDDAWPVDGLNGMGDRDGDGIWDMFDAYPDDYYNGDPWMGQPHFNYNGTEYYGSWSDMDNDGIPDVADSYPNDSTNGMTSTYTWSGNYMVDGTDTYLSGSYSSWDSMNDSDSDGIYDMFDPYPTDASNNTSYWSGGTFLIDGYSQWLSGSGYYATNSSGDSDGDGILDMFDPYPYDATNNTSWFEGGGQYYVDGISTSLSGGYYSTSLGLIDSDGDGIYDMFDPYPNDATNNTSWWSGGSYTINNSSTWFSDQYFAGSWNDSDGDGIPNTFDPYPWDSNNGTSTWTDTSWTYSWSGYYMVDGNYTYLSGTYGSSDPNPTNDSDGDGIYDMFDPYPYDATNNTSWWDGGQYYVDGMSTTLSGGYYSTNYYGMSLPDNDGDGILDLFDPYANDVTNNTTWWGPEQHYVDGVLTTLMYPYNSSQPLADGDNDGIPDIADIHPSDPTNNTSTIDGQYYAGHPFDGSHPETTAAWLTDWFAHPENRTSAPLYLSLTNLADTDGDGIPDEVEEFFGLNKNDWTDAFMVQEGSAYTNSERYLGWQDLRDASDPWQYGQVDGIPNVWKVRYGLSLQDPGLFLQDNDADGWINIVEYMRGTNPWVPDEAPQSLRDKLEAQLAEWNNSHGDGSGGPGGGGPAPGVDSDGDGVDDLTEQQNGTDPNDASSVFAASSATCPEPVSTG